MAGAYLKRERPGHTLQPTALLHEAYLRLVDQTHQNWASRSHFFGVAAHLMRLILVDWARKGSADKRGAGARRVSLDLNAAPALKHAPEELIALDESMTKLAAFDPRKAKIVEQRYFGGMTVAEVAERLGISAATVERETRMAQIWLCREMKGGGVD